MYVSMFKPYATPAYIDIQIISGRDTRRFWKQTPCPILVYTRLNELGTLVKEDSNATDKPEWLISASARPVMSQ